MIAGELLFAGEAGLEPSEDGSAGAVESSVYDTELIEQPLTLPAASVAVALNVVVVSSATATVIPGEAKAAAVPVAVGEPVHVAVV